MPSVSQLSAASVMVSSRPSSTSRSSDGNGASTPVEITPQVGDRFTDYVQYYTFDANNNATFSYELSDDVFTWGEKGFSFYSSYPVDGQYAVGIVAYDFDNNQVANFEFINYTR